MTEMFRLVAAGFRFFSSFYFVCLPSGPGFSFSFKKEAVAFSGRTERQAGRKRKRKLRKARRRYSWRRLCPFLNEPDQLIRLAKLKQIRMPTLDVSNRAGLARTGVPYDDAKDDQSGKLNCTTACHLLILLLSSHVTRRRETKNTCRFALVCLLPLRPIPIASRSTGGSAMHEIHGVHLSICVLRIRIQQGFHIIACGESGLTGTGNVLFCTRPADQGVG